MSPDLGRIRARHAAKKAMREEFAKRRNAGLRRRHALRLQRAKAKADAE